MCLENQRWDWTDSLVILVILDFLELLGRVDDRVR